jgi:hypothetical protein
MIALKLIINNLPYMPLNRAKMLTVAKGRPMLIKTPLCREFEKDLTQRMAHYQRDFVDFIDAFRPNHILKVVYEIYCPKDEFYTKEGNISSRCPDADSIKVLQDTIFSCLGIDDKHIKQLTITMNPSNSGNWDYTIHIFNRGPLEP